MARFQKKFDKNDVEKTDDKRTSTKKRRNSNTNKRRPSAERTDVGTHLRSTNDYHWYAYNERLLRDVGTISFNYPAGYNVPYALTGSKWNHSLDYRTPGILTLNLIPTVGISNDGSSALNSAARQIYNFIRAENSGARNYDAPDYMMYIMAVDSMLSYYAFMMRAYGMVTNYTFFNKYAPNAVLAAMGLDGDDLRANYAQFRALINLFAGKLGTFLVPKSFNMFIRHATMYGNVYKDAESTKAQLIMYNPEVFWKYNPTGSTTGATLDPIYMRSQMPASTFTTNLLKLSDLESIANEMIAAADDEDFVIMAGDTLKAWGPDGVWRQADIDASFKLEPIFDFTWLTQVQNAMSLDNATAFDTDDPVPYKIEQIIPADSSSPYLKATCDLSAWIGNNNKIAYDHELLLCSPYEEPTPGDVIESTRLMYTTEVTYGNNGNITSSKITSCGSELVANIQLVTAYSTANNSWVLRLFNVPTHIIRGGYDPDTTTVSNLENTIINDMRVTTMLSEISCHPTVYYVRKMSHDGDDLGAGNFAMYLPNTDLDNYTILPKIVLDRQHTLALMSLLYVRGAGIVDPLI